MHGKTEGSEEDIEDYLRFMVKKLIKIGQKNYLERQQFKK